jgi:hypothetical protein
MLLLLMLLLEALTWVGQPPLYHISGKLWVIGHCSLMVLNGQTHDHFMGPGLLIHAEGELLQPRDP